MTARLTVLAGPSGVGKGSVVQHVVDHYPWVWRSISVTTRPARPGELDGTHYHFIDDQAFDHLVANDELLEWATYAGYRYGTPSGPVQERLDNQIPVLLEIDLAGARQIRQRRPDAQLVFLAPPSFEVLQQRLAGRGTEDMESMARRLALARAELEAKSEFDHVIVNHTIAQAAAELVDLIGRTSEGS